MTEEEHLLAQIGELAGQINRRKNQDAPRQSMSQSLSSAFEYQPRHSYPYWRQLDPSAHAGGQETHSRAQIMNHHEKPCQLFTTLAKAEQLEVSGDENSNIGSRGVAKRGRGAKMWISEDALRRKLERRKHFASSIQAAVKDTALQPVISPRSETLSPSMAYITVEDIQFQVTNGGRKLLRITDISTLAKATPKEAIVSGVTFKRTRNGNLVRAGVAQQGFSQQNGKTKLCRQYTSTGRCPRGDKCFGIHDIHRTAICQSVLRGVKCSAGDDCDLTHESSSQVAPTCLHFQRGKCIKHSCPYSHAPVDPSAPLCRAFAYLGYCEQGSSCGQRHLRECPDYTSGSGCRSKHCALPHVDRASQMRRNAANSSGNPSEMDVDDISSPEATDEDIDSNAMDPDGTHEPEEFFESGSYELPQQQDYVGLT